MAQAQHPPLPEISYQPQAGLTGIFCACPRVHLTFCATFWSWGVSDYVPVVPQCAGGAQLFLVAVRIECSPIRLRFTCFEPFMAKGSTSTAECSGTEHRFFEQTVPLKSLRNSYFERTVASKLLGSSHFDRTVASK